MQKVHLVTDRLYLSRLSQNLKMLGNVRLLNMLLERTTHEWIIPASSHGNAIKRNHGRYECYFALSRKRALEEHVQVHEQKD
ncbi:hypothetical protein SAMN04487936_106166 [Halobacillus dabanensis]|uniref:Uncharacterized protein n=1 Tax=Halobacillus dabanensis TaxID=240302 RepID=A0A1I3W344_HALDA|nr:hypothetical protein SAMN04487936_106166 [Halobacillus dabanensis]